jgi:hypothetical protein
MGADEEETLVRLKAHRDEVADLAIAKHKGRIVKLMGDGVLVELASIDDPMHCNCTTKVAAHVPHRTARSPLAIYLEGDFALGRSGSPCLGGGAKSTTPREQPRVGR